VVDDLAAGRRAGDRVRVGDITEHQLHARPLELLARRSSGRGAHEGSNLVAARRQVSSEMTAGETGGAGD
jgi:hypothetical protein